MFTLSLAALDKKKRRRIAVDFKSKHLILANNLNLISTPKDLPVKTKKLLELAII